ncbi:hypothetical protein AAV94_00345 [Lampropedia cohaerens]|uniref:Allophanate hydrolase n=1 Tax=Lampropedia cohaerens TaxID=1610491 RepID=A0A0U1Q3G2_9BURK|nr:urea amidolyase family protein [Lampropedia cohaerens]KKW69308.1 hypothetical protein AAV94_00345 [Lampropedia cohaerens]
MRVLPVSDAALMVELADLRQTLALFEVLQQAPLPGVRETVPAARTILLEFAPWQTSAAALAAQLRQCWQQALAQLRAGDVTRQGLQIEIPVRYEGQDLEALAERLGMSVAQLIECHTSCEYQAAFAGFAPGFVYLAGNPFGQSIPRLASPRTRVPAGSVAVAGDFSAIYPKDSPGGWQLLGVTPCQMWDMRRSEPVLLRPGMRVRFVDMARAPASIHLPAAPSGAADTDQAAQRSAVAACPAQQQASPAGLGARLRVRAAGLQTLIEDLGRGGKTAMGVSASGALDKAALRRANRLVGNPAGTPALENVLGQLQLACEQGHAVLAVTGAPVPLRIRTACGRVLTAQMDHPLALDAGDVLEIGTPTAGVRVYVAVRGGLDVPRVLDSCATDTLAGIGPEPVRSGDLLAVGTAVAAMQLQAVEADLPPTDGEGTSFARAGDVVTLDVVLGPRTDWFTDDAVALLQSQQWQVTPQSNRVGMRLHGAQALTRRAQFRDAELPSEGTVCGALQVPPSGQPVLFLADHPLTGGYPVIGAIASWDLDRCAQIPVGAFVRLRAVAPFEALTEGQACGGKE